MSNPIKQVLYPEAHLGRNPFPMDNRHIMSAKIGMKIPCYVRHTVPKGVYDIDCAAVSRTDELQTANFSRISANVDFYFVPYTMLYHRFYDVYNGRQDKQRRENVPFTGTSFPTVLPNFSLPTLMLKLYELWLITEFGEDKAADAGGSASRSILKYRSIGVNVDHIVQRDYQPTSSVIDVEFGVKYDYSASGGIEKGFLTDVFGRFSAEDRLRLLDMLGYGNWLPVFQSFTSYWLGRMISLLSQVDLDVPITFAFDYTNKTTMIYYSQIGDTGDSRTHRVTYNTLPFMDITFSASTDTYLSLVTVLSGNGTFEDYVELMKTKLQASSNQQFSIGLDTYFLFNGQLDPVKSLQYLQDHPTFDFGTLSRSFGKRVSPFALAAYQKIWSDYSRNQFYDNNEDYSQFFNFDWFDNSIDRTFDDLPPYELVAILTEPRYDSWRKDLFTGGLPSAQFGEVAVAMLNGDSPVINDLTSWNASPSESEPDYLYGDRRGTFVDLSQQGDTVELKVPTSSVGISVASIRYANALQRYRETIVRAGNRTKDLLRAQFGVTSRFIDDNYAIWLGSFDGDYQINPVQATSNNDQTTIGQLGANGLAIVKGNKLQVNTSDFGVIIGVLSVIPRTEYDNFGISEHNLKMEQFDFWNPDFENLGLQPVLRHTFDMMSPLTGQEIEQGSDVVLSYSARYHEYKTQVDYVHGEFFGSNPLGSLNTPVVDGAFSDYVTPRPVEDFRLPKLRNFYIDPSSCDTIFFKEQNQLQSSDHFKFAIGFSETDVLPMSVTGLPYGQ